MACGMCKSVSLFFPRGALYLAGEQTKSFLQGVLLCCVTLDRPLPLSELFL